MTKVLVLGGAGAMASGTVRDLVAPYSSSTIKAIAVADSAWDRADALVKELNDPRLRAMALNVDNAEQLHAELQQHDLCINAIPTFAGRQMAIFDACLAARTTYVDYGGMGVFTVQQKKQHAAWKSAGATAVLGLGADPGVSNIICKAVAEQLDTIDRINLFWAATLIGEENPVSFRPTACRPYSENTPTPQCSSWKAPLERYRRSQGRRFSFFRNPGGGLSSCTHNIPSH